MPEITLEALNTAIECLETLINSKFDAANDAIKVARDSMEKRLDGMNEFRETLRDQAGKFITRVELDIWKDKMEADVKFLRESRAALEGKATQESVDKVRQTSFAAIAVSAISTVIAATSTIIAVLTYLKMCK